MLTQVDVMTERGTLFSFPLDDYSDGYTVKDIDGLDPVKATLVYSSFAGQDGTTFQSAHRENRFMKLKLGFQPNYAITNSSALRQRLLNGFMPKSIVNFKFYDDDLGELYIEGRVEDFISPRFTKEPDASIAVTCEEPDFDTRVALIQNGHTVVDDVVTPIDYEGTVETGFVFKLLVDRTISAPITIYNTNEAGLEASMPFSTPNALVAGDILTISTIPGKKFARLTHLGLDSSVLYAISPAANWLSLWPGVNQIRALVTGADVPWTIEYTTKFGGL